MRSTWRLSMRGWDRVLSLSRNGLRGYGEGERTATALSWTGKVVMGAQLMNFRARRSSMLTACRGVVEVVDMMTMPEEI